MVASFIDLQGVPSVDPASDRDDPVIPVKNVRIVDPYYGSSSSDQDVILLFEVDGNDSLEEQRLVIVEKEPEEKRSEEELKDKVPTKKAAV